MATGSGGRRSRSGPRPVEGSGRSERRGIVLSALPRAGFKGKAPAFPLPPLRRYRFETVDKVRRSVFDEELTEEFRERELAVWVREWKSPQAAAWSLEPWRWSAVAEFCRVKTAVEIAPDSNAALVSQLHRYRDQIGLTPAGLKDNGWKIEDAPKVESAEDTGEPTGRRLRAVSDG